MDQPVQSQIRGKVAAKPFDLLTATNMMGKAGKIGNAKNGANGKVAGTGNGDGGEDISALAPFLQVLNQQISQLFQTNKSGKLNITALQTDAAKLSPEQLKLISNGTIILTEVEKELAKFAAGQSGQPKVAAENVLKSTDLLRQQVATGDIKTDTSFKVEDIKNNILALAQSNKSHEQTNKELPVDGIVKNSTNIASQLIDARQTGKKAGALSSAAIPKDGNIPNIISSDKNLSDESIDKFRDKIKSEVTALGAQAKFSVPGTEQAQVNTKDVTKDAKSLMNDAVNQAGQADKIKSQQNVKSANTPVNLLDDTVNQASQGGKIKSPQNAQPVVTPLANMEASDFSRSELAQSVFNDALDKVKIETIKSNSKNTANIPIPEVGKKNQVVAEVNPAVIKDIKETIINQDNIRMGREQYQSTATATAVTKTETIQSALGDLADKPKGEAKGKIIVTEKGGEADTSTSTGAIGNNSAKIEKSNDISPTQIVNQVANEIKENIGGDGGRVKITLTPPSLGTIEMDVTVRNGKVGVVLVADNKDVQQSLNNHVEHLKNSLQSQGLTIERCDVLMQDKRDEYQQSFSQHAFYRDRSGSGNNNRRQEQDEKVIVINDATSEKVVPAWRTGTDKISLFA
jgi:flagellar hook-length control protein FliK